MHIVASNHRIVGDHEGEFVVIAARLCGGLGNQMFQYAAGRGLAMTRNVPLMLDLDWYRRPPGSSAARVYELHRYPVAAHVASRLDRLRFRLLASRLGSQFAWIGRGWTVHRERHFDHDPSVKGIRGHVYLDGYWQSARYFEHVAKEIRAELRPSQPLGEGDNAVLELMRTGPSVSVHVRRGDYVSNVAATATHGACTPEYFERACAIMASRVPGVRFFVFSDDMAWSRAALRLPGSTTFVDHNGPAAAFQDMRLMSLCDHHVIANSSFSWWGAWLGAKALQIVVAPKHWFADGRATATLLPADWLRV